MPAKPIFGYWNFRGLGQPIRLLLVYAGVDFEEHRYSKGEDGLGLEWRAEKYSLGLDFPNLPYYIDNDVKLTQSVAILRYLGRKHRLDGSGSGGEAAQTRIDLLENQIKDLFIEQIKVIFGPNFESARAEYLKQLPEQLTLIVDFLGVEPFVAGSDISWVDFWLYEFLVRVCVFAPDEFAQCPRLRQFMDCIECLPRVSEWITEQKTQGDQPMSILFNGLAWNGKY